MADQAVTLEKSEIAHVEELSDLYAVILQIEKLSKAKLRMHISTQEYEERLKQLIANYNELEEAVIGSSWFANYFDSAEDFWATYCSDRNAAKKCIKDLREQEREKKSEGQKKLIDQFDIGQLIVTLIDCISLDNTIRDVKALLGEIIEKLETSSAEFKMLPRLQEWQTRVDDMNPDVVMNKFDATRLTEDLVNANDAFRIFLSRN